MGKLALVVTALVLAPLTAHAQGDGRPPCEIVRQETERAVFERLTCYSGAYAVTSNGVTVGGQLNDPPLTAFVWRGDQVRTLGPGRVRDLDDDGVTAVGLLEGAGSTSAQPGAWVIGRGGRALERLVGQGTAITPDGRYAVGHAWGYGRNIAALRWDLRGGGRVELGSLDTGPHGDNVQATAISDDGRVVVGTERTRRGRLAFLWRDGRMRRLPPLGPGSFASARACNGDCSVIGGLMRGPSGTNEAVRWVRRRPSILFPAPAGAHGSNVWALDASGDVAGGEIFFLPGGNLESRGYLWTARSGLAYVDDIASSRGLHLGDLRIWSVTALSADGTVLVGRVAPRGAARWNAYRLVLR